MKHLPKKESGQALLLVLLSMSVVLTIVLSILARSTLDIGVSTGSEESVRAFSAAEAGIEQRLVAGTYGPYSGSVGGSTFSGDVTSFSSGSTKFVLPSSLYSGESATVWFVSHDKTTGNLSCIGADNLCFTGSKVRVCWGKNGITYTDQNKIPALEVSVIYLSTAGDYTTAKIARAVADPYTSRIPSNSFPDRDYGPPSPCVVGGQTFAFWKDINLASLVSNYTVPGVLQLARISLLYNTDIGHLVSVDVSGSGSTLPAQGVVIDSSGVSGASTRRVEVIRGFKELPGIFENVAFSYGGITQ